MNPRHHSPSRSILALVLACVFALTGCSSDEDEYGIRGPLQQSDLALSSSGTGTPGLSTSVSGASTEVWAARNNWSDTSSSAARAAGLAWQANSGLNWEQKYNAWIRAMEKTAVHDGYGETFRISNPQGKKIDVPYLECAELALMMRAVFASWYELPFFLEAKDSDGTRVFLGHFGFRTTSGRYKNTPNFKTRYNDYSHLSNADALGTWPSDSRLRGRNLYNRSGPDDINLFLGPDAGAGWYFDELLLNKRVGHFLLLLLPYFGSANLADDSNAYHATPESLRPGDILIKRWQRRGIGHVMLVKDVHQRPQGKMAAELSSGSMPRRQAVWESQAASKMLFTNKFTGGEGENHKGERYVNLGGGMKRFLIAEVNGGKWRNRVLPSDLNTYLRWSNRTDRAARPARFAELLVEVPPEEMRDELLAIIESKREHLRNYPASCSARIAREAAFDELYELLEDKFDMSVDEVDGEYRILEDYVFAELVYDRSKTCCWNSTNSAMFDVIMSYNLRLQEEAANCAFPAVFKATDGGYSVFEQHAQTMGLGNQWAPWNDDESCPQAGTLNDEEERHGWTPYCEVADTINGDDPTAISGDDPYEVNDRREQAFVLGAGSHSGAAIATGDDDWFAFTPLTGSTVRVSIQFEHRAGDLDMQMFRGATQVDRSNSTRDTETVDTIYDGVEPISVRVYGYEQATGPYQITVTTEGGVDLGDPCNDNNETMDDAFELDAGVYNGLRICNDDTDWFRIHATVGAGTLRIEFNNAQGNLDLELYRSNGELIGSSTGNGNAESIESGVGVRFLKVFGRSGAIADYTLRIAQD
jgi:hypothetical protein